MSWQWRMTQYLKRNWLAISKLTWGIWLILTRTLESFKNFHFLMCYFWAKFILFEQKKYRRVIFHETEEGYKIWRGIYLSFENWHKKFDKIWPERSKVSKMFILMSSFWAKKVQRNNLSWSWRGIHNLLRNQLVVSKFV